MPAKDRAKLAALVEHYELVGRGNPSPAQVEDYGDEIYRLRHIKPAYQRRLLFFVAHRIQGAEKLIILIVYKKETDQVPASVLETAKRRKREWEEKRRYELD